MPKKGKAALPVIENKKTKTNKQTNRKFTRFHWGEIGERRNNRSSRFCLPISGKQKKKKLQKII
jgi:hypothetical protein